MPAESELTFIVSFPCPSCKASLESPSDQPGAWIRCPKCGRAGRAPDALVRKPPPPLAPGELFHRIEAAPEPKPMTPVAVAPVVRNDPRFGPLDMYEPHEPAPLWKVACGAGLFVSVMSLLFAFLEKSEVGIIGSGVVALIMFVALVRGGAR